MSEGKKNRVILSGETLVARKAIYTNGGLAVMLFLEDGEHYGNATVNLGDRLASDEQYLDTNNKPNIVDALVKAGAGQFTGRYAISGYCRYPLFRFSEEWLKEIS